jgi:2-keto-3-deoxy-L-rhamnonate aldolase RhmA
VISEEAKSLDEILYENNAITGINGVFFCPADYRACNGKNYTINERFVD